MKILHIVPALNSGGVERSVSSSANYQVKAGHKVYIISAGGVMKSIFDKQCVHIKRKIGSKNPIKILLNAVFLKKFCIINKIDIVHAHSRIPAIVAHIIWRRKNTKFKLVTTVHGVYSIGNGFKRLYNSFITKSDAVIVVSDFVKSYVMQNYFRVNIPIHTISQGVEMQYFDPQKVQQQRIVNIANKFPIHDKFIMCMPARITEIKGHVFLLEALSLLNRDDYVCLLVGSWKDKEKYKKKLETMIQTLNLSGKIQFTGDVQDMPALYMISDLIINPSIKPEAFCKTVIEANAMGKYVISTNIGAVVDNIIEGKTGFLIPPRDKIALSQAIANFMNSNLAYDSEKAKLISEITNAKFDILKTNQKEVDLYAQLIKDN